MMGGVGPGVARKGEVCRTLHVNLSWGPTQTQSILPRQHASQFAPDSHADW